MAPDEFVFLKWGNGKLEKKTASSQGLLGEHHGGGGQFPPEGIGYSEEGALLPEKCVRWEEDFLSRLHQECLLLFVYICP